MTHGIIITFCLKKASKKSFLRKTSVMWHCIHRRYSGREMNFDFFPYWVPRWIIFLIPFLGCMGSKLTYSNGIWAGIPNSTYCSFWCGVILSNVSIRSGMDAKQLWTQRMLRSVKITLESLYLWAIGNCSISQSGGEISQNIIFKV